LNFSQKVLSTAQTTNLTTPLIYSKKALEGTPSDILTWLVNQNIAVLEHVIHQLITNVLSVRIAWFILWWNSHYQWILVHPVLTCFLE